MKILMIVESPAKSKTIEKYLKVIDTLNEYKVMASYGHIRDLVKKELGIDIEHQFKPTYVVSIEKTDQVDKLKKACGDAEQVLIASDPDREGESIAWHLVQTLKLPGNKYKRITFNEISRSALEHAIKHPRKIDMDLVDAQQTRRIIDRLMGFKLSPLLWKAFKVTNAGFVTLSAGRVQSACLKLVVDRHQHILQHDTGCGFWKAQGIFVIAKQELEAALYYNKQDMIKDDDGDETGDDNRANRGLVKFEDKKSTLHFLKKLKDEFSIVNVDVKERKESPGVPYITSSLQQDAHNKLGFDIKSTMKLAQDLYEAGHITYMRTDSHTLSEGAVKDIHAFITRVYDTTMIEARSFNKNNNKNAQEAHEAIRPTVFDNAVVDTIRASLSSRHASLYELIFKRTVSSQMKSALYLEALIHLRDPSFKTMYTFIGSMKVLKFPGWLVLYSKAADDLNKFHKFAAQAQKAHVTCKNIIAKQSYTNPPAYYTESSLVKTLEKEGIGRPSTYAGIITKLYEKNYIAKESVDGFEKPAEHYTWTPSTKTITTHAETIKLGSHSAVIVPKEIGLGIHQYLDAQFGDMISTRFTAEMEDNLDAIAGGDMKMTTVLDGFWGILKTRLDTATQTLKTQSKTTVEADHAIFDVDGVSYKVRYAQYGPVIENISEKQYINLKPYMAMTKKNIKDMTLDEIQFLVKLPMPLRNVPHIRLAYARYGFYIIDTTSKLRSNYSIFPNWIRKTFENDPTQLRNMTLQHVDELIQSKDQAAVKKQKLHTAINTKSKTLKKKVVVKRK